MNPVRHDGSRTIGCPLREAARKWPEALAVQGPEGRWTYAGLDRHVTATAARLTEALPAESAPVAICLPNGPAYLVLLWALLRLGRTACLLSTRLPPEGVRALLDRTGCAALVTARADLDPGPFRPVLAPEALLQPPGEAGTSHDPIPLALDRPATVVFTSGSTGLPRAAVLTLGNHVYNARGSNQNIALAPGDRWLLALPLYHVGGLAILFRCVLAGATVVLPPPGVAPGTVLAEECITHVSLVATQLYRLLRDEAPDGLDALKAVLLGGSAIPSSLLRVAVARGLPVHTTYGMTEMASQVTTTPPGAGIDRLQTSGRLLPHRELRIADDGEILVRGPTLFAGYLDGGRVRPAVDADGWFHTRDLGALDARGYLHVHGRKDNQFISGGENIQPEVIEQALVQIEGVRQAVVVPVPHDEYGQRPVAFLDADPFPEEAVLRRHLAGRLPRFMIPDAFLPWPGSSPGMKLDRQRFRHEALRRLTPVPPARTDGDG